MSATSAAATAGRPCVRDDQSPSARRGRPRSAGDRSRIDLRVEVGHPGQQRDAEVVGCRLHPAVGLASGEVPATCGHEVARGDVVAQPDRRRPQLGDLRPQVGAIGWWSPRAGRPTGRAGRGSGRPDHHRASAGRRARVAGRPIRAGGQTERDRRGRPARHAVDPTDGAIAGHHRERARVRAAVHDREPGEARRYPQR